jgi:hypothetical protein
VVRVQTGAALRQQPLVLATSVRLSKMTNSEARSSTRTRHPISRTGTE